MTSNSDVFLADKVGFFFGAGASKEFSIPQMTKLTLEFSEHIKKGPSDQRKLFLEIYNMLEGIYGNNNVDLEAIMSVIDGLKEKEHLRENVGDLGVFFSVRRELMMLEKK